MKRIRAILLILMIAVVIMLGQATVFAADTIRDTDVDEASAGNVLVLYDGEFKYLSKDTILSRINELRLEACEEGVPDPRNSSRNLTKSDYVPIKWSAELEWIAQTRAAEGSMYMSHTRPNGSDCFSATHNGMQSYGEVLAWNGSANILYGINQWYGEKEDWVNKTAGAVTGHYTQMIDPDNTYVGIGAFLPEESYGTVAGEFSSYYTGLDETQAAAIGKCSQIVEVQKDRISAAVSAPGTIHIGKDGKASLDASAGFPDGVWSVTSSVAPKDGVSWSSSDTGIATVDASGTIKGISPGTVTITATAFGGKYTASVRIEDHSWNKNLTVTKKATCMAEGSGYISCSVCGAKKPGSDTVIAKTGHSYGDWVVETEATVDTTGLKGRKCTVCAEDQTKTIPKLKVKAGAIKNITAGTVKILSTSSKTVAFRDAANKASVTVPATVKIKGKTYKVTQINANAFKGCSRIKTITIGKNVKVIKKNAFRGSKATKLILKTKLLKKAKVKGCLKGSKIKTIQVKVGSGQNKKYVKNYRKIFTKTNAGRKVTVK